jgi:cellulose synthase/poly-beta-1,6-N-acetylglucosamine synthase-like glycosyltransferase
VTVQLPIFNEQYVVERLLESICKLKYPREKLDIQVLDDSTDETVEVARAWSNATPRWEIPSATITAPTARASRQARWPKA